MVGSLLSAVIIRSQHSRECQAGKYGEGEGGRNSCSRDSAWYLFLVGSCGRPGIMAAVTMINLAGRVVTWSSGRVAYVSMLFPSGERIDFSLSCRPCQHDVLVYHSMLDTECLHYTPINMSRPAPHAEFPRPGCEAAPAGRTRTVWAARWAPSVISGRGRGRRDPVCWPGVGSRQHSAAGGDAASSWNLWWKRILEPLEI